MYLSYLEPFVEDNTFKIIHDGKEIALTENQLHSAYLFQKYLQHKEEIKSELQYGSLNPETLITENEPDFEPKDKQLFDKVENDPALIEELTAEMERDIYKYNCTEENYFDVPDLYSELQQIVIKAVYKHNK